MHPKAQVEIGERFAEHAGRGKQVIVSTHSHYLILDCDKREKGTEVTERLVDASGRVDGEVWIPSFAAVEYRRSLVRGGPRHLSIHYDRRVMEILASDLLERRDDPTVLIQFGPDEDRFHLQLAIDAGCGYHVSWDRAVLREAENMARFGVAETNPPGYVAANM